MLPSKQVRAENHPPWLSFHVTACQSVKHADSQSGILSDIFSDTCCSAFYVVYYLAFYLLHFYLAHLLHFIWGTVWQLAFYLMFFCAYFSTVYLSKLYHIFWLNITFYCIWHIFRDSMWHLIWFSIWQSTWQICWLSVWGTFWHSTSDLCLKSCVIVSDILSISIQFSLDSFDKRCIIHMFHARMLLRYTRAKHDGSQRKHVSLLNQFYLMKVIHTKTTFYLDSTCHPTTFLRHTHTSWPHTTKTWTCNIRSKQKMNSKKQNNALVPCKRAPL